MIPTMPAAAASLASGVDFVSQMHSCQARSADSPAKSSSFHRLSVGHKLLNRLGGAAGHARNSPSFPPSHLRSQPSYSIEHWQGWHSKLAPMPRLAQLLQLFFVHGLHAKFFLSLATMQPLLLRASKYTSALPTCTHFCKIIVSTYIFVVLVT